MGTLPQVLMHSGTRFGTHLGPGLASKGSDSLIILGCTTFCTINVIFCRAGFMRQDSFDIIHGMRGFDANSTIFYGVYQRSSGI
jgi:hypothetical protein